MQHRINRIAVNSDNYQTECACGWLSAWLPRDAATALMDSHVRAGNAIAADEARASLVDGVK